MMGVEAVNRILLGSYEICLNMTSLVNMRQDAQTVEMMTQTLPSPDALLNGQKRFCHSNIRTYERKITKKED
eukprot:TRINITY_DN6801_c0_g1_i2.p2 TRINITY_DN6801_c0_g1~~TRINITY_DN6801_c0_g1_i2.p2  ORF type:complete len:72 (+),score=16.08 TRINITY_DN6801_c0_g1_i2:519-734(+)